MNEKFDINMLRQAVGAKLKSIEAPLSLKKVKIFEGSHSPFPDEYEQEDWGSDEEETHENENFIDPEKIKQNLFQLSVYSAKLHDMIEGGNEVPQGVEEQIVEAVKLISDIYHELEYANYKESD